MSRIKLRPYQEMALAAEDAHRAEFPEQNRLAIEMATGLGKTIVFAERVRRFLYQCRPGNRALILVHTDELVTQAAEKIQMVLRSDDMPWTVGIVKATRNDIKADVIVASVQTLARPGRREQIADVGYIVVDECHHATARTYVEILQWFGADGCNTCSGVARILQDPNCSGCQGQGSTPTLGVTATLKRTDGVGLGKVWDNVVFSRSMVWGARKGHLTDIVPYTIRVPQIDASASDAQLDTALCDSLAPEAVVQGWMDKAATAWDDIQPITSFPSTVLFAPGVASAREFATAFSWAGIKAEIVHGGTPAAERRAILDRYEAGVTTVLCNAMVLTEGWDSPRTKCVIVARPTKSVPLFVQMVGRGVRPWLAAEAPPREDQRCILLCIADTATELATYADLSDDPLAASEDGRSLLQMQDEYDLGRDIDPDGQDAYRGPVAVERWDEAVQRSSKAWKYTVGGTPFLPTAKRQQGYVFITPVDDHWTVWAREPDPYSPRMRTAPRTIAPDLEMAMALAEDEAQELGGDIGALLADKTRAWRKAVPSVEMLNMARRVGVREREIGRILASKSAGKAGRLSDLIDKVTASRVLDPVVEKIRNADQSRERASSG